MFSFVLSLLCPTAIVWPIDYLPRWMRGRGGGGAGYEVGIKRGAGGGWFSNVDRLAIVSSIVCGI